MLNIFFVSLMCKMVSILETELKNHEFSLTSVISMIENQQGKYLAIGIVFHYKCALPILRGTHY